MKIKKWRVIVYSPAMGPYITKNFLTVHDARESYTNYIYRGYYFVALERYAGGKYHIMMQSLEMQERLDNGQ